MKKKRPPITPIKTIWEKSKITQTAYFIQKGINLRTFQYWDKKFRKDHQPEINPVTNSNLKRNNSDLKVNLKCFEIFEKNRFYPVHKILKQVYFWMVEKFRKELPKVFLS
jgi:hypothetical protein